MVTREPQLPPAAALRCTASECMYAAQALHGLSALTELNLRRNAIASVSALEALPSLQRLFLSNNAVAALSAIACLGAVPTLLELALDGNPYAAEPSYRHATLELCRHLRRPSGVMHWGRRWSSAGVITM